MEKVHKLNEVIYKKMVTLYEQGRYPAALDLGRTLLESARRLRDAVSEKKALEVLSYASYYTVDYVGAMSYVIQFARMVEEAGIVAERIKTYNVFISLYIKLQEYEEAKKLLDKVESVAHQNDLLFDLAKNESNYGFFYNSFGEYHKAIPRLLKGIEICEEHHFNVLIPGFYVNLAAAYIRTGDYEDGKKALDIVFTMMDSGQSGLARAEAYMYKGELLALEGNYEEGLNQVKASKVIAERYGYTAEMAEATMIQATIYKNMGDFEKGYKTLEAYIKLNAILFDTTKRGTVTRLKMEYDVNKREIEADILREQNAVLEERNRKIQEQSKEMERLNDVLSRQNDDLHQSAIEDYMTGVYNRKYFALKLQEEFGLVREQGGSVACIIFDIDKFKRINDTYGHLVGDEMIKHVSAVCEEALDSDSIIGRFGGDEFMILMVDATIEDAERKANEFLEILASAPLKVDDEEVYATLSLGVADSQYLSPKTTDELVHIADQGLYIAKERGRNQCARYEG